MAKLGHIFNKQINETSSPTSRLVSSTDKVGIEVEVEHAYKALDLVNGMPVWRAVEDGSLRNQGTEFVTVGGLSGTTVVEAVEYLCNAATKFDMSDGYPRAGIHIHLDCTDLEVGENRNELKTLIAFYLLIEDALYSYAGEWRRYCGFCEALGDVVGNVNVLKNMLRGKPRPDIIKSAVGNFERYCGLNLVSLQKYGTIEFRHLPTTFDSTRIIEWINIIMQLKKAAQEWNEENNLLNEVSIRGVTQFVSDFMGPMWGSISPHFNERSAWGAMEMALSIFTEQTLKDPAVFRQEITSEILKSKIRKPIVEEKPQKFAPILARQVERRLGGGLDEIDVTRDAGEFDVEEEF